MVNGMDSYSFKDDINTPRISKHFTSYCSWSLGFYFTVIFDSMCIIIEQSSFESDWRYKMTSFHRNFSECYAMMPAEPVVKPIEIKHFSNTSLDDNVLVIGCSNSMLYLIANNANP
jgi:hypothetical protein